MKKSVSSNKHRYMLYARVSPKGSDWHAEETSIAMQVAEMKAYITESDPRAEFFVQSDEFKSGKDLNRPGIQAVLSDLDLPECPWGTLVVWALDRLSRSIIDAVPILEHLRDAACEFVCVRQSFLSTKGAMSRLMLNQTIAMAQFEREMTAERVKAKMVYIASQGKPPAGVLPLGYRRITGQKNCIEPDPKTAPAVLDIFQSYLAQKEPVADLRRRYSEYLSGKNQLYRLLRNRLYIGEIEYDGEVYPGKHKPIIERSLFDAVQGILPGTRRSPRPHKQIYNYLLQGLVICKCGKRMVPYSVKKRSDKRYFYYKCQDTLNCKKAVNAERLDEAVLKFLRELLLNETFIKECYEEYQREQLDKDETTRLILKRSADEIAEVQRGIDNLNRAFQEGLILPANAMHFNKLIIADEARKAELEEKHHALEEELKQLHPEDDLPDLLTTLRSYADLLDRIPEDFPTKRNLVLSMVKNIRCIDDDAEDSGFEITVMTKGTKWRSECGLVITGIIHLERRKVA